MTFCPETIRALTPTFLGLIGLLIVTIGNFSPHQSEARIAANSNLAQIIFAGALGIAQSGQSNQKKDESINNK